MIEGQNTVLREFIAVQAKIVEAIHGLIALQAAPRKKTVIIGDNGMPAGIISEVISNA